MKLMLDKTLIFPLVSALVCLIIGWVCVLSSWAYSEPGHELLFGVYGLASVGVFVGLRFKYKQTVILLLMLLVSILAYSQLKFNWRKEYIIAAQSGIYFSMDPYIPSYPTFEEHVFSWVTGTPEWVDFNDDCLLPALNRKPIKRSCKSVALIESAYGFNVKDLINTHYRKMQNTAKSLEKGRLKTKARFMACLKEKNCAAIPLLPANVDIESFDEQSDAYSDIRNQFWSIMNDNEISPENCEFVSLCRAMRDIGVIAINRPDE